MRQSVSLAGEWKASAGKLDAAPASAEGMALRPPGDGDAWWLLPFEVPADWSPSETELHIEGGTRAYELFINGARAGACAHAFVPAEFPITRLLKPGGNMAAVRFLDDAPAAPVATPVWNAAVDPAALTGTALYGETTLAGFPAHRIERVRVWPDVRRKLLEVEVDATSPGKVHLRVEGLPIHHEFQGAEVRTSIELPRVEPWSPTQPSLYALTIDYIAEDGTPDRVRVPFALREVSVKEDQFHCNGRPLCVRGVWHAPLSGGHELATTLMTGVRNARLNSVRLLWPDSATLRAADEAGLLVFVQWPRALNDTAAAALMERYHAHPSLAGWWQTDEEAGEQALRLLWNHDPTRLVLEHGGNGTARFYRPRKQQPENAAAFSFFASPPFEVSLESYWRRIGAPGALTFVESLSAFHLEDAPPSLPQGLDGVVESPHDLLTASQGLQAEAVRYPLDAFRLNPQVAGYWLQGLTPFPAWPNSAIANSDGTPRTALRILEALHRPIRPVIHMEKSSLCVREEVHVNISLLNDARMEGRGEVFLQVIGPTNQVLWKKRRQLRIPRHGKELWSGSVAASGSTGKHKFVVRLLQDEKVLGDSVFEFHVMEAAPETQPRIHLIDPRAEWESALRHLARLDTILAPVHVLPPLGPSIFAAPDNELMQSLAQVKGGAALIVFNPPADWNELADRVEGLPRVEVVKLAGTGRLYHLYTRQHPMWEGLPARTFLRQPYRQVAPVAGLRGESDEAIAGWYKPAACDAEMCHTVLSTRYGQGRIVFVSFRLIENLGADALADRAFVNLVQHVARRAFAPRQPLPLEMRVVEWMRQQRRERMRRWLLIGEFPNTNGEGYATAYPPEQQQDFDAAYPGWRSIVRWKPWSTLAANDHRVDFAEAFAPPAQDLPRQDAGVGYAYAEFTCARRLTATLTMWCPQPARVWLNGKAILEHEQPQGTAELPKRVEAEAVVKQGRNTMLVKMAKGAGPFWFEAEWSDHRGDRLAFTWWK